MSIAGINPLATPTVQNDLFNPGAIFQKVLQTVGSLTGNQALQDAGFVQQANNSIERQHKLSETISQLTDLKNKVQSFDNFNLHISQPVQ